MDDQKMNTGEGSIGPIIATIIILAILVLGGLYFWNQRVAQINNANLNNQPGTSTSSVATDAAVNTINQQSTSDSTASIEADLKATDITNVDSQLNGS